MNRNKIYGLDDPENNSDAANKSMLTVKIQKRTLLLQIRLVNLTLTMKIQNKTLLLQIKLANLTSPVKQQKYHDHKMHFFWMVARKNILNARALSDHKEDDPLET